jgi:hypothetical protein
MVRLLATELRMTDYVLTGLVKRRAELAGEIEATHDRLRKMIEDLEKLDSGSCNSIRRIRLRRSSRRRFDRRRIGRTVAR